MSASSVLRHGSELGRRLARVATVAGTLALLNVAVGCVSQRHAEADRALLEAGAPVPDLSGTDQNGITHSLRSLGGKTFVVYFYPKDGTPGCTKEACAFRDVWGKYEAAGVLVFGVSRDTRESHQRFATEHRLPFPLISDPEGVWAQAFGVRSTLGLTARVTFLVGPDGKIAHTFPSVDPGVHATEVLAIAGTQRAAAPAAAAPSAAAVPATPPPAAP